MSRVTLDICNHETVVAHNVQHVRCPHCPPIPPSPMRKVVRSGTDNKDGYYEVLSCEHTIYPKGKPASSRRCDQCATSDGS